MGKEERYNVDGADDGLGESSSSGSSQSAQQTTEDVPNQEPSTEADGSAEGGGDSIPHRVRYDSPQEDRDPLNLHVDMEDKQRLRELTGVAEAEFDETVWETDVKLAAFRCDITDEDAFLREMREIGYGYFD